MELASAQADLRRAYVRGGPGAVISGFIWLTAAIVSSRADAQAGFAVLFFGGMLIYPLSLLLVRGVFRRQAESGDNPGGPLVMETIPMMIGGLFAAWLFFAFRPEWVFPLAAIAVGAHYFPFRTAYGDRTYWVLATVMCGIGLGSVMMGAPAGHQVAWLIAGIEVMMGAWLIFQGMKQEA